MKSKTPINFFVQSIVLLWIILCVTFVIPHADAQSYGSTVSVCETNWVDPANYIEQTACLYGGTDVLSGYVDTENYGWEYLGGSQNTFVANVAGKAKLFMGNTLIADPDSSWISIKPQLNVWYRIQGYYAECYDPFGNGDGGSCSWGGVY